MRGPECRGDKIRVLHCLERVYSGGAEQVRLRLAAGLDSGRFEQLVFCTEASGPAVEAFGAAGVEVVELGPATGVFDRRHILDAARRMRAWRPDIVHGAVFEGCITAAFAGRLARVPRIVLEEVNDPSRRSWRGHLLFRALVGLADHCVGVSPAIGRYLTDQLRVPRRKVTVINNGVERPVPPHPQALATLRERYGIGRDDLVVGSVGRVFDIQKRFSDLIEALSDLRDLPVKALIVGDGPDVETLRRRAEALGLADRVILAGFQSPVDPFYAIMDVFALASAEEAFGLVVAEAMRAGLPVVATRVGGVPDVVAEGETGLLVPPRQPAALAGALRRLLADAALRRRMGAAGRERADCEFTAERYVRDVERLYVRLLNRQPSALSLDR